MNRLMLSLLAGATLAVAGCVTPVGPVEVTRFHAAETAALGRGTIAIEPAPGTDGASLEWQTYKVAVERQLALLGYTVAPPAENAQQVALVRIARTTLDPVRGRNPVSVGVGGSTGSYGSGLGIGLGINLGPKPKAEVATDLGVTIRDRATVATLWEGRASFSAHSGSPLADTGLAAPKMAAALFKDFPGQNGATIEVR